MAEKKRYIFVDLLRGLALLVMIEVHVFNAFLDPSIKAQSWFSVLNYINGLVAPSFLFVSGFAFILSTNSNERIKLFSPAVTKRLSRIGLIFLVGYSLHLPRYSFTQMMKISEAEMITFYNVDVLQCIATGLLLLLLMKVVTSNEKHFNSVLLGSTIAVIGLAPFAWQYDFTNVFPVWLANYFNQKNGSLFPLFPWLGFMFTGAIAAKYFLTLKDDAEQKRFISRLTITGITLVIITHLVLTELTPLEIRSIRPNPFFFLQRLGYVFLLLVLCWHYDQKRKITKSFILDFSRESLIVYWFHLTVLFAVIFGGKSLTMIVNHSYNVIEAIIATIILVILMIIAAKIWGGVKSKYRKASKIISIVIITSAVIVFFIR